MARLFIRNKKEWRTLLLWGLAVLVVFTFTSCGGNGVKPSDSHQPKAPPSIVQQADAPQPKVHRFGTTDIQIELPGGQMIDASSPPKVEMVSDLSKLPMLDGNKELIAAGNFSPEAVKLPQGAKVTWKLAHQQTPGTRVWIVTLNEATQKWLGTGEMATVAESGVEATGRLWHFSNNGLSKEKPADFEGGGNRNFNSAHFTINFDRIPEFALVKARQDVKEPDYIKKIAEELEKIRATYVGWITRRPNIRWYGFTPSCTVAILPSVR
jgi:hypothetical protein